MKIISQNLQARIRETMLMSISNESEQLFLCQWAANRSCYRDTAPFTGRIITCSFAVLSHAP